MRVSAVRQVSLLLGHSQRGSRRVSAAWRASERIIRSSPVSSSVRTLSHSQPLGSESDHDDLERPMGALFEKRTLGPDLLGKTASIRRTFGPRSSPEALLICGGAALAAHASFDPDYKRAQGWIRHHAVGPAVLSPILISGLVGALVEAAFPEAVPDRQSLQELCPLIVGVEIKAEIEVVSVVDKRAESGGQGGEGNREYGYQVGLETQVTRVRDNMLIAKGEHIIWIPDYRRM